MKKWRSRIARLFPGQPAVALAKAGGERMTKKL
jgi:hypothetical protein